MLGCLGVVGFGASFGVAVAAGWLVVVNGFAAGIAGVAGFFGSEGFTGSAGLAFDVFSGCAATTFDVFSGCAASVGAATFGVGALGCSVLTAGSGFVVGATTNSLSNRAGRAPSNDSIAFTSWLASRNRLLIFLPTR